MSENKNRGCHNCVHRHGMWRQFWKCSRTGYYTAAEMQFGGKCADGHELRLWSPRHPLLHRVFRVKPEAA